MKCQMKWLKNMAKFSRNKGKRGELELSHALQKLGFPDARRSQQFCGSAISADLSGIPGIHAEVKRTETLSLYAAYAQAVRDAGGSDDIPVVFHRRNGKPWLVILSLEDWATIYEKYVSKTE